MSKIHWSNPVDGDFNTAADWSTGSVPGASDGVFLGALGGTPYTVTASASEAIRTLSTAADASLDITGGVFAISSNIANQGMISVDGGSLKISSATTLTGGGQITLGGTDSALIGGGGAPFPALLNVDNTISGAGHIGGPGALVLKNQVGGVVDATGPGALTIEGRVVTVNAGLIEATGSGGLTLQGFVDMSKSDTGVVLAGDGSKVSLKALGFIIGGTLQASGSGKFVVIGNTRVANFRVGPGIEDVSNQATIQVRRGFLDIDHQIRNTGDIHVAARASGLSVGNGGVTLTGGGSIELRGKDAIRVLGGTENLVNEDNTISGAGHIGGGMVPNEDLRLDNLTNGVIDANRPGGLVLDTGADRIVNAGTIEATGGGDAMVRSMVDNTGTLETSGASTLRFARAVTGDGSAVVGGGTLAFAKAFTEDVAFDGNSGVLELGRSQSYAGDVSGFSKTGGTVLDLRDIGFVGAGEATFSGNATTGVLTVSDGTRTAHITLIGDYTGVNFVASGDGAGGVDVATASAPGAAAAAGPLGAQSRHRFVSAMAGLGDSGGPVSVRLEAHLFAPQSLIAPRQHIA